MIHDSKIEMNEIRSGYLLSVGTAFYLVGKFLNGWISGVIGGRWSVGIYQMIIALSAIGFSFSFPFGLFLFFWGCLKFGQSAAFVSGTQFINPWFSPRFHGMVFGIFSAASSLGDFTPRLALGAISHEYHWITWRHQFFVMGCCIAIFAVLTFVFLKDSPNKIDPEKEVKTHVFHPLDEKSTIQGLFYFLKSPSVYLLFLAQSCMTIVFTYSEEYVPLYFSQVYNLSPSVSSMISSICIGGSILSVLLGGIIYDRLGDKLRMIFMVLCFLFASLCISILAGFSHLLPFQASVVLFSMMYIFLVTPFYLVQGLFAVDYGGKHCGILLGLTDGGSYLGGILFSSLGGYIIHGLGWGYFLGAFAVLGWIGTASLLLFYLVLYFQIGTANR
jgi:sugar phosphate permease